MLSAKPIIISSLSIATITGGIVSGTYYLSQDKTISDKLTRKGITLISNQNGYEVAFIENRGDTKLVTILSGVQITSNAHTGGLALKNWCEEKLKLDLSEKNIRDILPNVEKYCSKPSTNIEERYSKLNKQLIPTAGWNNKARDLKAAIGKDSELKTDLGVGNFDNDDNHNKVAEALKNWCGKSVKTELAQDKEDKVWKKVEGRCLENK